MLLFLCVVFISTSTTRLYDGGNHNAPNMLIYEFIFCVFDNVFVHLHQYKQILLSPQNEIHISTSVAQFTRTLQVVEATATTLLTETAATATTTILTKLSKFSICQRQLQITISFLEFLVSVEINFCELRKLIEFL